MADANVLTAVLAVFTAIADWFTGILPTVMEMFFADGALTFLGVLAVAGLGVSIIFLLIGVISNFLHFRG